MPKLIINMHFSLGCICIILFSNIYLVFADNMPKLEIDDEFCIIKTNDYIARKLDEFNTLPAVEFPPFEKFPLEKFPHTPEGKFMHFLHEDDPGALRTFALRTFLNGKSRPILQISSQLNKITSMKEQISIVEARLGNFNFFEMFFEDHLKKQKKVVDERGLTSKKNLRRGSPRRLNAQGDVQPPPDPRLETYKEVAALMMHRLKINQTFFQPSTKIETLEGKIPQLQYLQNQNDLMMSAEAEFYKVVKPLCAFFSSDGGFPAPTATCASSTYSAGVPTALADTRDIASGSVVKNIQKALTALILKRIDDKEPMFDISSYINYFEEITPTILEIERRFSLMQQADTHLKDAIQILKRVVRPFDSTGSTEFAKFVKYGLGAETRIRFCPTQINEDGLTLLTNIGVLLEMAESIGDVIERIKEMAMFELKFQKVIEFLVEHTLNPDTLNPDKSPSYLLDRRRLLKDNKLLSIDEVNNMKLSEKIETTVDLTKHLLGSINNHEKSLTARLLKRYEDAMNLREAGGPLFNFTNIGCSTEDKVPSLDCLKKNSTSQVVDKIKGITLMLPQIKNMERRTEEILMAEQLLLKTADLLKTIDNKDYDPKSSRKIPPWGEKRVGSEYDKLKEIFEKFLDATDGQQFSELNNLIVEIQQEKDKITKLDSTITEFKWKVAPGLVKLTKTLEHALDISAKEQKAETEEYTLEFKMFGDDFCILGDDNSSQSPDYVIIKYGNESMEDFAKIKRCKVSDTESKVSDTEMP